MASNIASTASPLYYLLFPDTTILGNISLLAVLFQEYFYGPTNDLSPNSNIANFNDLSIYRIGGGPAAPRSALPIGAEPTADPTRLVSVNINRDLLHLVLAVSFAKEPDQIISRYKPNTLDIQVYKYYTSTRI